MESLTQLDAATAAFNDAGFRAAIAILDENNVPGDSRVLVVSPTVKADMLGVTNYVSTDFVTGQSSTETGSLRKPVRR